MGTIIIHFCVALLWSYACAFAPRYLFHYDNNKIPFAIFMSQKDRKVEPYPVISKISSINWIGTCRYVDADLVHLTELKLTGGLRYDINGTSVRLSSFLTFPNGKTREVIMLGNSESKSSCLNLRKEGGGPIRMQLTELGTDTILVNEIEEATGKIILTSSLSIVEGSTNGTELIQISHEVGEGELSINGHQVWRLKEGHADVGRQ